MTLPRFISTNHSAINLACCRQIVISNRFQYKVSVIQSSPRLVHVGWFEGILRITHAYLSSSARSSYLSSISTYIKVISEDTDRTKDTLLEFFCDTKTVNMEQVHKYLHIAEKTRYQRDIDIRACQKYIDTHKTERVNLLTNEILSDILNKPKEDHDYDQKLNILKSSSKNIQYLVSTLLKTDQQEQSASHMCSSCIVQVRNIISELSKIFTDQTTQTEILVLKIFYKYFLHYLSDHVINDRSLDTILNAKAFIQNILTNKDDMSLSSEDRDNLNLIAQMFERFLVDHENNKLIQNPQYRLPIFYKIPVHKEQQQKIGILRRRKIEQLVCLGGGAKGLVLETCIYALNKYDQLEKTNINRIVGISVGALHGALMASCSDSDKLQKILHDYSVTHAAEIVRDSISDAGLSCHYPSLTIDHDLSRLQNFLNHIQNQHNYKNGLLFVHKLAKIISQNIQDILKSEWKTDSFQTKFKGLNDEQKTRLTSLKDLDMSIYDYTRGEDGQIKLSSTTQCSIEKQLVTFKDLELLHQIIPNQCKELEVLVYEIKKQQAQVLNATTKPNMPIVYAVRASMSFPLVFYPVQYEDATYADGGIGDITAPLPWLNNLGGNTIIIGYALHKNGISTKIMTDVEEKVNGNPEYRQVFERHQQWKMDNLHHLIDLRHDGVDTFDLNPKPRDVSKAQFSAQETVKEYIEMHGDELESIEYPNLEEAIHSLSAEEKETLLSQSGREEYHRIHKKDRTLYQEVVALL